jgi:predicted ArsR family transcriptional regulator
MNIIAQLKAANTACPTCGRPAGGRPVVPTSKRQRVLAYLDDRVYATTREIADGIGLKPSDLSNTLNELRIENKIESANPGRRPCHWRIVE